jgi:hypothetical protein
MSKPEKKNNTDLPPKQRLQAEDLPAWAVGSTGGIRTCGVLKSFSSPPSTSKVSRLEKLKSTSSRRTSRTVRNRPPPKPVDTTRNNSEIKRSASLSSTKDQDVNREQVEHYSSALSGYIPGGSSHKLKSSEDSNFTGSRNLSGLFSEEEPEDDPEDGGNNDNDENPDLPKSTLSPGVSIKAKMSNFDVKLEHLVKEILKYPLSHHVSLGLDQSYINTFHEFRMINIDNFHTFTYKKASAKKEDLPSKLRMTLVKAIQCCVHYCQFLQDDKHTDCDDPTLWFMRSSTRGNGTVMLNT